MLDQVLRYSYQRLLVNRFAKFIEPYATPIQITCIGGLIGINTATALFFNQNTLAIFLLLISGYCDTLDGTLARHQNKATPFGTLLDILIDRTVEFSVILGLWFVDQQRSLACLTMLGCILLCVTSFLVVGIFSNNQSEKSFHYSPGIIERAEAFIFFILMILFPTYFYVLAYVFSALVLLTTIIRVYEFRNLTQHCQI